MYGIDLDVLWFKPYSLRAKSNNFGHVNVDRFCAAEFFEKTNFFY